MKFNKWTLGLAAVGVVSLASVTQADEASSPVLTALSSTTISGYVDTTAIWKFGSGNAAMPGRVYDGAAQQDRFNLNVVSLTLDKPLTEDQWAAGYHVQLLFGPGAQARGTGVLQPFGANNSVAFNEAYVALRVPVGNGLDLKVGQFGTYNGYEAYDTYKNPNWSRSYGFFMESSAHTGVSASYKITDNISVMAGIGNAAAFNNQVNATTASFDSEGRKAYLGMITLTAPESFGFLSGASLTAGYTGGTIGADPDGAGPLTGPTWNQENFYLGASIPTPVEGLSFGLAFDYTAGMTAAGSHVKALAGYLAYKATDKLTINNRIDYGWGSNFSFYDSTTAFPVAGSSAITSPSNELISDTLTVDYSLWANVISRVELRWDHCLTDNAPFGGTSSGADGDENALSVALNIIYKF